MLFLIFIPIILFVGLSTYYNNRLDSISSEYDNKLKQITANAVLESASLSPVEQFKKDKESLEQQYVQLRAENEELQREMEKLSLELNSAKSQAQDYSSKYSTLLTSFQEVQNSLVESNEAISRLSVKVKEVCRKLRDAGGEDNNC